METTDTVESTIRRRTSLGHQTVNVGMEIYALSEGLDHGRHSRHELQDCGCVEKSQKCAHCAETERIEEFSVVTEEKTKHFGNGKDELTARDIEKKFLPHPLAPFLSSRGMTRRTEPARLAGKHQQVLLPTVRAPDAGKPAHRIAAVEILLDNILGIGVFWIISIIIYCLKQYSQTFYKFQIYSAYYGAGYFLLKGSREITKDEHSKEQQKFRIQQDEIILKIENIQNAK